MKRDIVDKLEFGCPFKPGSIGEKDSEVAEVLMQEAANEITNLRRQRDELIALLDDVKLEDGDKFVMGTGWHDKDDTLLAKIKGNI